MPEDTSTTRVQVDAGRARGMHCASNLPLRCSTCPTTRWPAPPRRTASGINDTWDNVKSAVDACPRQAISPLNTSTKGQ